MAQPVHRSANSCFLPPGALDALKHDLEDEKHRAMCADLCQHVPEYKDSNPEDIECKQLMAALTNVVYKCFDPKSQHETIYRHFGHIEFGNREIENDVFRILGEANVGPKFIAGTDDWRIESCVPGHDLDTQKFRSSPQIRTRAAQKLAHFHKVEACAEFLPKDQPWFFPTIKAEIEAPVDFDEDVPSKDLLLAELHFLDKAFKDQNSQILFCHNDYRPANIMCVTDDHLVVVDLETAGYNYRGFDLGRTLSSINLNVTKKGCDWIHGGFPEPEVEQQFFTDYLTEFLGEDPSEAQLTQLANETKVGYMAALLHLIVWSAGKAAEEDEISWNYGKYSHDRWQQYLQKKDAYVQALA